MKIHLKAYSEKKPNRDHLRTNSARSEGNHQIRRLAMKLSVLSVFS